MDSRVLTHLSVEDLNLYLLGGPSTAQRKTIEEHYLGCSECLDQICALAARIDKSQLGQQFVPVPVSPVPNSPAPQRNVVVIQRPTLAPWQGWALKAVAASAVLLVIPNSARLVRVDQVVDSPIHVAAMNLPFTREFTPGLELIAVPKLETAAPRARRPRVVHVKAYREFQAPVIKPVQFQEVAFLEAPELNFDDPTIDPMPIDLDPLPPVYHSKPNIFKRLFSAVASSFRSSRM